MTKIEMINEIKNVVMNNGGYVNLGWVTISIINGEVVRILHGYEKKVKYESVAQIQIYLDCLNDYVAKNAKTVETEVENDTEYVAEPKATKKDILMGLNENGEVKCDLATAEALATEGFIGIKSYEDGVLYGYVLIDNIFREMVTEDEADVLDMLECEGWLEDTINDDVICLVNLEYVSNAQYLGGNNWKGEVNYDVIFTDFCKRWDNKLNEAA